MNPPIENGTVTHHEERPYCEFTGGKITHTRRFSDDSGIMYYDNNMMSLFGRPRNGLDDSPSLPPTAYLYYWQVIRNRPDIKTWEDIRRADKEDQD
jgi:hypothetical protein